VDLSGDFRQHFLGQIRNALASELRVGHELHDVSLGDLPAAAPEALVVGI
jgi:hypothetical protein